MAPMDPTAPRATQALESALLEMVSTSRMSLTPGKLLRHGAQTTDASRRQIQAAIRTLVASGKLAYTYRFGHTFIEESLNRALRLSPSVVLKPHQQNYHPRQGEVVIEMQAGAAFGDGGHPTTCLAVQAVEYILKKSGIYVGGTPTRALDIGTGTGILALAALALGVERAVGLDRDPCARYEAGLNARLNGMTQRFRIAPQAVEDLTGPFDLVLANLRTPTLHHLLETISRLTSPGKAVVLSGFRPAEAAAVIDRYVEGAGYKLAWKQTQKGWAAVALLATDAKRD